MNEKDVWTVKSESQDDGESTAFWIEKNGQNIILTDQDHFDSKEDDYRNLAHKLNGIEELEGMLAQAQQDRNEWFSKYKELEKKQKVV